MRVAARIVGKAVLILAAVAVLGWMVMVLGTPWFPPPLAAHAQSTTCTRWACSC
jgi:hypothetical protein